MTEGLYTLPELGALLKVSVPTLRTWKARGLLHTVRLPGGTLRVRQEEVDRIMREAEERGATREAQ